MLELKLLGSPQILLAGRPVNSLVAAKSQALLFYLAVTGRPQSRLALAGLLWPDKREADALANLRQALYHLRNALPDYLAITRLTVALNPAQPCQIDAALFETEVAETNPPAVRQRAVDGYTGEFLAGFQVDEAEPFEAWAVVIRERLHRLATETLHQVVAHFTAQSESRQGLHYTNQWLTLEPWREEAHRYKMQLLALAGQRQAALDYYGQCQQLLREELNATPDAETVAIYEQIRSGAIGSQEERQQSEANADSASQNPKLPARATVVEPSKSANQTDWGEAPTPTAFYGRQTECAQVAHWLGQDHCRLVMILGLGGMGKTALAVQVAHGLAHHFAVVIWRSLLNAPPLTAILAGWLHSLAPQPLTEVPTTLDAQLALLFDYLRQRRCLLILDNCESILQTDTRAGLYRPGYEGYGQLLRRMGTSDHQSTLLLTSREQPQGVELLPRDPAVVQVLRLTGLEADSGQTLLQSRGIIGVNTETAQMISQYSGNPLALQIVAQVVVDLFDGDLTAFLSQEVVIFDDIRDVLDQQWARLTALERDLLLWLAIERERVGLETLRTNLVGGSSGSALMEALRSLQRRSLIEQHGSTFALQNVVTEYLTDRLITTVSNELVSGNWHYFDSHALIRTQAKEYVRESQIRIILAPLAARLVQQGGRNELAHRLREGLAALRQQSARRPSYAGGNVLNLLIHLGYDLRGYDFSNLCVWQANLQNIRLPAVNFADTDLRGTIFTESFRAHDPLAWSPTGDLLAVGTGSGEVRLWHVAERRLLGVCVGHSGFLWTLAFSPDGRWLASAGADQTVSVWEVHTRQLTYLLRGHTRGVRALIWTADGTTLISGSLDQSICLWNIQSGQLSTTLYNHQGEVRVLAVSPNGKHLVSGTFDGLFQLWELPSRQIIYERRHGEHLTTIAWGPDGRLLATGGGPSVQLWDSATGTQLFSLIETAHVTRVVAFSPDGSTLASGDGHGIRLWNVNTRQSRGMLYGHIPPVTAVAWSPDGAHLASLGGGNIRVWDWQRGQIITTFQGYSDEVLSVVFSPDGRCAASSHTDNIIRIWETTTWQVSTMLFGHKNKARDVRFTPDGATLISGGYDQTVRLWDSQSGQQRCLLGSHNSWIGSMTNSPDGRLIATSCIDCTIWLWDIARGQVLHILREDSEMSGLAFSPDSRWLAAGSLGSTIHLWDTKRWQAVQTLHGHTQEIHSLAFDHSGHYLLSASADETIGVWDLRTGQRLRTLVGHTATVNELALHPTGVLLASCGSGDQTVRLWDWASGTPLGVLPQDAWVVTLAFSPDGRTLLVGCEDGRLRLWDVQSGQCQRVFRAPGPYAGMNITGVTGISDAQKAALKALGAIDGT
ncbi:MAG: hypothetical protein DYG89_36145 [Caldilinea sp. CFX5]|nr:hypothetical protein [Caldilinea sp. CFX5]